MGGGEVLNATRGGRNSLFYFTLFHFMAGRGEEGREGKEEKERREGGGDGEVEVEVEGYDGCVFTLFYWIGLDWIGLDWNVS